MVEMNSLGPNDQPDASIVIVNFNGAVHLRVCLQALSDQQYPRHRFEIIVVDNHSHDESRTLLAREFPEVIVIENVENLGFATANNLGIARSRGDVIILLNNDTIPDPFWLAELLRTQKEYPDHLIASKLVLAEQPDHLNSTGLFLLRDGRGADRGFKQRDTGAYEAREEVFCGCAAALAIPRTHYRDQPIFEDDFFLYYEDLDFGWGWQLSGKRVIYEPRAVVLHQVGASGGDRSARFWFFVERNRTLASVRNGDLFLMIWSILGLYCRGLRALIMALSGSDESKYRWPAVRSVLCAGLSFLFHLPAALTIRFDRRTFSRRLHGS